MGKVSPNGTILRWARRSNNLTLDEVAKKMGKNPEQISAWEKESARPTYVQLEKLAYQVYKRPLALFFFPEPPEEKGLEKDFRTLPSYELDNFPNHIMRLFRYAQAMQINLRELYSGLNPAEREIIQDMAGVRFLNSESAESVRNYLKVTVAEQKSWPNTREAFKNWRKALENVGVFIFKDAFRFDALSGFCLYDEEFPIIYVNNSMPRTRQIFTLFHELVHLLSGTGGIDKINDSYIEALSTDDKKIEIFCNEFAAQFLVPGDNFEETITGMEISLNNVRYLADRYLVSREVILRRLLEMELVNESFYNKMVTEWIEEAKDSRSGGGGNYYWNKITYLGERYINRVLSEMYRGRINERQAAEYLDIRVDLIGDLESYLQR